MVANYNKILPEQTDRNSPVSQNLMDTVRENLDALNDAVDELEKGGGSGGGNGDGNGGGDTGGTTVSARPVVAELRGDLSDISNQAPVDFPYPLNAGQLKKAKVTFQNLESVREFFSNSLRLLRRSDRNYLMRSISYRVRKQINVLEAFAPGVEPDNYTHQGDTLRWTNPENFTDEQTSATVSHDGEYGIARLAATAAPNERIWREGTRILQKAAQDGTRSLFTIGTILSYNPDSKVIVFRIDVNTRGIAFPNTPGTEVIDLEAQAYKFDLNASPGGEYEIGEACNLGFILDKNIGGNNLITRVYEIRNAEGDLTFSTFPLTHFQSVANGTVQSGRVTISFNSLPSIYPDLDAFFPVGDTIFLNPHKGGTDPGATPVEVTATTASSVTVKNQIRLQASDSGNGALYTNKHPYETTNADDLTVGSYLNDLLVTDIRSSSRFVLDLTKEKGFYNPVIPTGRDLIFNSSRYLILLSEDVDGLVNVGGFVSFTDFAGNHNELYEVVGINENNTQSITIEAGTRRPFSDAADGLPSTGNIFAYYENLTAQTNIEDGKVTRISGSHVVDISANLETQNNSDEWTFSVLFSKIVPGLKGIAVEVV